MGMHFELNRETLKAMQNEAGHTVMEKALLSYVEHLHNRIGRLENDKNKMRMALISIYNRIPEWIPEVAAKAGQLKENHLPIVRRQTYGTETQAPADSTDCGT